MSEDISCNMQDDAEIKRINNCSGDVCLTYEDWLAQQDLSTFDALYGNDPLDGIDPSKVLAKQKTKKPNPRPWIAFNDLNNSDDAPYENKPKPAIEIGIAFDF